MFTDSDIEDEAQRRRAERVRLPIPIAARLGSANVVLSDISMVGAGVQHHVQISNNETAPLVFRWEKQDIIVDCKIVRSRLELFRHGESTLRIYHSGLAFAARTDGLERAIENRIARAIERQHADAYAEPLMHKVPKDSSGAIDLNALFPFLKTKKAAFVRCSMVRGVMRREWVNEADQPEDGFTVSADESPAEIDLLCRTYTRASSEEKRLIRIFAHLSVTEPSDIPRYKFRP